MTRSDSVVFDAEPLLAYLADEPGAPLVEQYVEDVRDGDADAYISTVTLTEVKYVADRYLAKSKVTEFVESLLEHGVERVDASTCWYEAAEIKNEDTVSLGDAFVLATAQERGATALVGADDDFDGISRIDVERFRENPA